MKKGNVKDNNVFEEDTITETVNKISTNDERKKLFKPNKRYPVFSEKVSVR